MLHEKKIIIASFELILKFGLLNFILNFGFVFKNLTILFGEGSETSLLSQNTFSEITASLLCIRSSLPDPAKHNLFFHSPFLCTTKSV